MNLAIWANLFWKEWREHQWKLAALATILFGTFFAIWAAEWKEGALNAAFIILIVYTPLASLFIGMGLAAGEQARGTADYLQRLPKTPRGIAIVKLVIGYATIILPGLALIALCGMSIAAGWINPLRGEEVLLGPFQSGVWWLEVAASFAIVSASLLIWNMAIGVNQATELRAGVLTLVVAIGVWSIFIAVVKAIEPIYEAGVTYTGDEIAAISAPYEAIVVTLSAPLPGGMVVASNWANSGLQQLVAWLGFGIVHAALLIWWVARYARCSLASKRATTDIPAPTVAAAWLRPPRRTPSEAILWKQFREAGPIIVGVVALAVGWTLFQLIDSRPHRLVNWIEVFTVVTTMCGFLAALLVGVGGFQDDLNPGTSAFWRSRPIPPRLFYWLKYAGGFGMLAIVFGSVFVMAYQTDVRDFDYSARYVVPGLLVFWLTYATAVTMACLVRNAIYAGILTILPVGYGMAMAFSDEFPLPMVARVIVLILACMAMTALGLLSMRNDWAIGR